VLGPDGCLAFCGRQGCTPERGACARGGKHRLLGLVRQAVSFPASHPRTKIIATRCPATLEFYSYLGGALLYNLPSTIAVFWPVAVGIGPTRWVGDC
jgi:hypothetical protein